MNLLVLARNHPSEQFDLRRARFRSDSPAHHRRAAAYPAACDALAAPSSSTWTRSAPRRLVAAVCPRTARSSGTPAPTSPVPAAPPPRSAAGGPRSCRCSPAPSATPSRRTTARKRHAGGVSASWRCLVTARKGAGSCFFAVSYLGDLAGEEGEVPRRERSWEEAGGAERAPPDADLLRHGFVHRAAPVEHLLIILHRQIAKKKKIVDEYLYV